MNPMLVFQPETITLYRSSFHSWVTSVVNYHIKNTAIRCTADH
uniref:Uncharacterized protein n=1 Tax=Rhizophora mucronata TaxID=61149 RepID=A0A2P2J501_RHIMU